MKAFLDKIFKILFEDTEDPHSLIANDYIDWLWNKKELRLQDINVLKKELSTRIKEGV